MSFGFGFGLPSWQTLSGGFSPASLFANGEQGAFYQVDDYGTLFQDSAGTTPVTAVEQFVGLMLDKRVPVAQTGYYSGVFDGAGDELSAGSDNAFAFGNGAYTVEFWTYLTAAISGTHQPSFLCANATGGWIIYNNAANLIVGVRGVSNDYLTTSLTAGVWNHVVAVRSGTGVNQFSIFVNGARTLNTTDAKNWTVNGPLQIGGITLANYYVTGYMSNVRVVKGTAVYDPAQSTLTVPKAPLTAISGTSLLTCQNSTFIDNSGNNFAITAFGDAKTGAANPFGNHATSTGTKRPKLAARYNLLTYTEQFDNGAWAKPAGVSITPNTDIAPDGTLTADTLTSSAGNSVIQTISAAQNTLYTESIYIKKTSGAAYQPGVYLLFSGGTTVIYFVRLNTDTGVATAVSSGGFTAPTSFSVADAGNYWQLSVTGSSNNNTTGRFDLYPNISAGGGVSAGSQVIWGADLRPASQATGLIGPTYQRVVDAATYDTVGFLPYLQFDGIDDSMSTGSIDFTATDKMTVWAGVRKQAAGLGMIAELSASVSANNGSFYIAADNGTNDYGVALKGTAQATYQPATYTAPITNVISAAFDIGAAAIADENKPRVNGVLEQDNPSGANAGTGNFGNYPLYIGQRNNASFPFNGWLTSLIVRGAQSTQSQIEATESWVNQRTGAY